MTMNTTETDVGPTSLTTYASAKKKRTSTKKKRVAKTSDKPSRARTAKASRKPKTTQPKTKRAPATKKKEPAKRAYHRTGEQAFEARPWRDATEIKTTMNPREKKVYAALVGGKPHTVAEMAERAFGNKPSLAKAKWTVRNALRRLRDSKLVKRVDAGTYQRVA